MDKMNFALHKETTAEDIEAVIEILKELASEVRKGDMRAFEEFFIQGGTEEGDAKICLIREMILMRYWHREDATRTSD